MNGDLSELQIVGPFNENAIAARVEQVLSLHLEPSFTIQRNFLCPTPWANFNIDLVLSNGTELIGIECDSKNFEDQFRNETRDSIILGLKHVDTIWRFRGIDIDFAIHDCLFVLSKGEPSLFTDRGKKVLWTQACDSVREYEDELNTFIFLQRRNWRQGESELLPHKIEIIRNSRIGRWETTSPFWKSIFKRVCGYPNQLFDEVVAAELERVRHAF